MTDSINLEAYFRIESQLLTGRFAEAIKAVDREKNEAVCLWVRKDILNITPENLQEFLTRMEKIDVIEPPVSEMLAYGVDSAGKAFAVYPANFGDHILSEQVDQREAERRFFAAVNLVAKLHENQILLGDLSDINFLIDRDGRVSIQGLLGIPEKCGAEFPEKLKPFFAPEVVGAEPKFSFHSDVYALGVIGYKLFTGDFPYADANNSNQRDDYSELILPSNLKRNLPGWVDSVLSKCLSLGVDYRLENAGQILKAISDFRDEDFNRQNMPIKTISIKREADSGLLTPESRAVYQAIKAENGKRPIKTYLVALGATAILLVAGIVATGVLTGGAKIQINSDLKDNPDLEASSQIIVNNDASFGKKLKEIQKLSVSADPVAHHMLVSLATSSASPELQQAAESGLLERARRGNLNLTARQVEQSLRGIASQDANNSYVKILNILDSTMPMPDRLKILSDLVEVFPELALSFSVAQAFDFDKLSDFRPVYQQALVKLGGYPEKGDNLSALGLIVTSNDLALVFADEVVKRRETFTNEELPYVLELLASRNDINTRAFANLAMERKAFSPVKLELLKIVRDRSDLPSNVLSTIVRAVCGEISSEEIKTLGQWYDHSAENVILALLTTETDLAKKTDLFDSLAARNSNNAQVGTLIEWISSSAWEDRAKFVDLLGKLAYSQYFQPEDFSPAIEAVKDYLSNAEFSAALMQNDSPVLINALVQFAPDLLSLQQKLALLKHEDSKIRIAAVNSITTNDIGALKMVMGSYDLEKDPEVRAAYRKNFWVLKDHK